MFTLLIASLVAVFDSNMSVQEMKQTGMTKLTVQEKQALENWIDSHYSKKSVAQNQAKPATLEENLKNGSYVRLSDNSLWEINPADTPITQGWITPVEIKVSQSGDITYPFNLTNTLTGSTVRARKAQSLPPVTAPPPSVPVTPSSKKY